MGIVIKQYIAKPLNPVTEALGDKVVSLMFFVPQRYPKLPANKIL